MIICYCLFFALDFVGSAWSFRYFHPRHNGQWPMTLKDFHPRFYTLLFCFCPILIRDKGPVFPFKCWVPTKETYWYHLYNIFGMMQSLNWIEPGTSHTGCLHSTTRLSRRRSLTGDWTRALLHLMPALNH